MAENSLIRDSAVVALLQQEADLSDIFANQRTLIAQTCARHILVATIQEAQEAVARLGAGERFEYVVAAVSLDPGSPGGLLIDPNDPSNCVVPASRFVQEFADALVVAPVGEPFGPVQTQFGWHVIEVLERIEPESLEAFTADPLRYLDAGFAATVAAGWEDAAVARAEIKVASQLGRWNPATDGIVPPDDATVSRVVTP